VSEEIYDTGVYEYSSDCEMSLSRLREVLALKGLHVVTKDDMRALTIARQAVRDSPMWMRAHMLELHDAIAYAKG
jgi:hypothetical protein